MKVKVQLMVSDVGHEQACGAPLRTKGHHTITFPNPLRHPHHCSAHDSTAVCVTRRPQLPSVL
jgi:hypothetical protein